MFKLIGAKKLPYDGVSDGLIAKEFLCDTDADFDSLPECDPGSSAISIESGTVKVVDTYGRWVPFGVYTEPPAPSVDDSIVGTWRLNDELDLSFFTVNQPVAVSFTSNGEPFKFMRTYYEGSFMYGIIGLKFSNTDDGMPGVGEKTVYVHNPAGDHDIPHGYNEEYNGELYRNITFDKAPSAEVEAWVRANATKVG